MVSRFLIVLLLALNLGVALWWWLRGEAPEPPPAAALSGVPPLVLLADSGAGDGEADAEADAVGEGEGGEAHADQAVAAAATDPVDPAPSRDETPAPLCIALGPYADEAAALAAQARLRPLVTRMALRSAARAARGWRVHLPALADREAAQEMAGRLRAAGFSDLYVVPDGPEAHSIALGRYGAEAAARSHAEALQAAGFAARAEALGEAGGARWIDVVAPADADAKALRAAAGAEQANRIDCGSVG